MLLIVFMCLGLPKGTSFCIDDCYSESDEILLESFPGDDGEGIVDRARTDPSVHSACLASVILILLSLDLLELSWLSSQ